MDTVHECDRQTDRQTDGQTDGRTDRITITDTVQTASHGKNPSTPNPRSLESLKKITFVVNCFIYIIAFVQFLFTELMFSK